MLRFLFALALSIFVGIVASVEAAESPRASESLAKLEQLKIDVIALTRDITLLKEQMTHPDKQKLSIYFSLTDTAQFELQTLKLLIDEQLVKEIEFSERQRLLLERGGAERLFVGNIAPGEHVITAFFTGTMANGETYKRGVTAKFHSDLQPLALALTIEPAPNNRPVHFSLVEL